MHGNFSFPRQHGYGYGMKPFLLITTRPDADVAAEEHASYCRLTGLLPEDLEWRRIDEQGLGDVEFQRYSGIILAGSPFTVSEATADKSEVELQVERELSGLLDRVVAEDFPFLGICYGIGTIGAHQGAIVDRTYGEPTQATTISLTAAGVVDALFRELPPSFDAFVGHKEAITVAPPHVVVLASSPGCPVQAFRVGENVYATQFHPELDPGGMSSRIRTYADHGYFDPAEIDALISRIERADVRASHLVLGRFVEEYLVQALPEPTRKPPGLLQAS